MPRNIALFLCAAAELLVYLLLHFLIFRISQETGENDHAAKYR